MTAMSRFEKALKQAGLLALLMFVLTVLGIVYGFVFDGHFTLAYVLTANFFGGAIIILTGMVVWFGPMRFQNQRLIDHTTYAGARYELREKKRRKGMEILLIGIAVILMTAMVELALWSR